jgi:KaiC/GvpD/RAD55 family RecA-like ATPase
MELTKLPTGIIGFDQIANGGIPKGRSTLMSGTAGSGKTVMALQFLLAGVRDYGENGVFVTFEEAPADLMQNVRSFGWDLEGLVNLKQIAVVDATPEPGEDTLAVGPYDLSALLARIENAIRSVGAKRVILDAIGALFPQLTDANIVRRELHRIAAGLRTLGVTTLVTMERTQEDGDVGRWGVEEFVADNVILLRNRLEHEKRRRTVEILKFRGATHHKGEYPFTIDSEDGVTIIPLSAIELKQHSSNVRVSSGVPEIDKMCSGGMYRDSIILVSGATGTGKTLMVSQYIKAAIEAGERALLFAAEESREQLTRNAASWGVDFEKAETRRPAAHHLPLPRGDGPGRPPAADQARHARFQAAARGHRQHVGLRARVHAQELPRICHRADQHHQAPGDHRAVHQHDEHVGRWRIDHRNPHLHHHRHHRAAALRGAARPDAARPDGAENARHAARQEHPRVHHRRHGHARAGALPRCARHPQRRADLHLR